jgi:hypothetical protein
MKHGDEEVADEEDGDDAYNDGFHGVSGQRVSQKRA